MNKWHKNLTQEKWNQYHLHDQILMIGSELVRAINLGDESSGKLCLERAFELIDLTAGDNKLGVGRKEILRLRELLAFEYISIINKSNMKQYYNFCLDFAKLRIKHDFVSGCGAVGSACAWGA